MKLRVSWTLSLICSIVYAILFWKIAANDDDSSTLLFGFCVWGAPQTPDSEHGCYNEPRNSHMLAFGVDMLLTAAVIFLFYYYAPPKKNYSIFLLYVAIGFIIFAHGILHLYLYQAIDCYVADPPIEYGYILFNVFTFLLCEIILSFGFLVPAQQGDERKAMLRRLAWITLASLAVTSIVVKTAKNTGSQWMLPALFSITHPLSSITGLFTAKTNLFPPAMGWMFLIATLTGIAELTACDSFYKRIGGHVWYDVTLHCAILMALPKEGSFDINIKRKQEKAA